MNQGRSPTGQSLNIVPKSPNRLSAADLNEAVKDPAVDVTTKNPDVNPLLAPLKKSTDAHFIDFIFNEKKIFLNLFSKEKKKGSWKLVEVYGSSELGVSAPYGRDVGQKILKNESWI